MLITQNGPITVRWSHQNKSVSSMEYDVISTKQMIFLRVSIKKWHCIFKKRRASLCFSQTKAANWEHATWNQKPGSQGLTQTSEQGHTRCTPDSDRETRPATQPLSANTSTQSEKSQTDLHVCWSGVFLMWIWKCSKIYQDVTKLSKYKHSILKTIYR